MVWSIFPYGNSFITTTKVEINEVPCLKFKPKGYKGLLPTVIYYHGWHSSKEFKRFEALIIASFGYQVIVPDALHHGDRDPIDHDDPQNVNKFLWKIVLQSVKESEKFINHVIKDHAADPSRIAVLGSSMGAISAGGIYVCNPNLKCLIGFNGTFAWEEAIKRNDLPLAEKKHKDLIECFDPMNNVEKIKDRAILMLHGLDDTSLPIDIQRLFIEKIQSHYTRKPEIIKLVEVSKVNHSLTTGMLERAIMWLKEHL